MQGGVTGVRTRVPQAGAGLYRQAGLSERVGISRELWVVVYTDITLLALAGSTSTLPETLSPLPPSPLCAAQPHPRLIWT